MATDRGEHVKPCEDASNWAASHAGDRGPLERTRAQAGVGVVDAVGVDAVGVDAVGDVRDRLQPPSSEAGASLYSLVRSLPLLRPLAPSAGPSDLPQTPTISARGRQCAPPGPRGRTQADTHGRAWPPVKVRSLPRQTPIPESQPPASPSHASESAPGHPLRVPRTVCSASHRPLHLALIERPAIHCSCSRSPPSSACRTVRYRRVCPPAVPRLHRLAPPAARHGSRSIESLDRSPLSGCVADPLCGVTLCIPVGVEPGSRHLGSRGNRHCSQQAPARWQKARWPGAGARPLPIGRSDSRVPPVFGSHRPWEARLGSANSGRRNLPARLTRSIAPCAETCHIRTPSSQSARSCHASDAVPAPSQSTPALQPRGSPPRRRALPFRAPCHGPRLRRRQRFAAARIRIRDPSPLIGTSAPPPPALPAACPLRATTLIAPALRDRPVTCAVTRAPPAAAHVLQRASAESLYHSPVECTYAQPRCPSTAPGPTAHAVTSASLPHQPADASRLLRHRSQVTPGLHVRTHTA